MTTFSTPPLFAPSPHKYLVCDECGSLVIAGEEDAHADWHERLTKMIYNAANTYTPPPTYLDGQYQELFG